ncbi:right-handed parallel beta-helix repeat-containing protein [bacterium]|nr:right-handed parallel beta-helix repeat-containing protein [bacterium]
MRKLAFCCACLLAVWAAGPGWAQITVPSGGTPDMAAAISQVGPGGTITVVSNLEADQNYFVGVSCTIQGQNPSITLRRMGFTVTAGNVTFRNLVIDGKSTLGQRNPNRSFLLRFTQTSSNILLENCTIINPASGVGDGLVSNPLSFDSPGAGVRLDTGANVTIRNCNFSNAVDAGIDNEVCVFFSAADPTAGPVLIEDCTFAAHSRGIQFNSPHGDVTIRNNYFPRTGTTTEFDDAEVSGIFLATDYNPVGAANGPTGTPMRNLRIYGNVFGGGVGEIMENNAVCLRGRIESVEIYNNDFTRRVDSESVLIYGYGRDVYIHDNVANGDSNSTGMYVVLGYSTQMTYPDPGTNLYNVVVRNEDFTPREGTGVGFGENMYDVLVEKCTFTDCPVYGVWSFYLPCVMNIRNNVFTRCGLSSGPSAGNVEGAILFQSEHSSAVNNVMIDCRDGVSFDPENLGRTGANVGTNNVLVAGNTMLRCTRYGIDDTNQSDAPATDPPAVGIKIVNNTFVFPGLAAMALRSKEMLVYNNLMHGGTVAITNVTTGPNAGTFAPTFQVRGFNLNSNNTIRDGLTATDITANPRSGRAGADHRGVLALLPDSPARTRAPPTASTATT